MTTDTSAPAQDGTGSKLKQAITGPLLFLFILGDVLGAGIYALMGTLSKDVGGALWAPLVLALLLALLTAGSYAELVTKYPKAGGAAVFAERAYKVPLVSFLVGFSMLAAGVTSAAGLSLAFAGDYLGTFIDVPPVPAAIVFLALVACLNARGISDSLRSNVVMTIIELSGLVIVIVTVAVMMGGGGGDVSRVGAFPAEANPALATLSAAIVAYYSFVGFETSANVAEEVREPRKVYPRALFGSLATAGVVYVLVALASSIALPASELSDSSGPLLAVVAATGVPIPEWVFSIIALVAVANGALLTMIMASRVTYGMAEQRLLPRLLGKVLPNRKTPWTAIIATTVVAMLLTLVGDVGTLAETVVLLLLFVFISTNIAVLVLRKDRVEHEHFRVWTFVPVLGVASCILLLTQQSGQVWLYAAVLLAVGVVLYFIARATRGRERTDSETSAR
ncbi:amino acid permease [Curtobacterium sp. MCPF17_047]|uniref:APC family permease n=1 Tax=unclassified Curtobacterium TaxID=257496 RepID=UPI000D9DE84D|nr:MULTISPECIES: APC family permease [unclassified Curtobacterium]PYY34336.1 amino acid permease [Curtobacterium sp. MCBD17_030]PZE58869.1 amino acid permease [Curtobacterium sp. MCPF17_001]PZF15409.1 amino acid permease [Curtobacterium sp. MCPF17_011]PZF69091.1 amino acid permease [Curtobacterium sp. MCPF17_047]